jgi:hypothetical protein
MVIFEAVMHDQKFPSLKPTLQGNTDVNHHDDRLIASGAPPMLACTPE